MFIEERGIIDNLLFDSHVFKDYDDLLMSNPPDSWYNNAY